jgi:hypothetical protein
MINYQLVVRDTEFIRREHKRAHPRGVFVQDLLRKTWIIGVIIAD